MTEDNPPYVADILEGEALVRWRVLSHNGERQEPDKPCHNCARYMAAEEREEWESSGFRVPMFTNGFMPPAQRKLARTVYPGVTDCVLWGLGAGHPRYLKYIRWMRLTHNGRRGPQAMSARDREEYEEHFRYREPSPEERQRTYDEAAQTYQGLKDRDAGRGNRK
jgi:hypothetical protein